MMQVWVEINGRGQPIVTKCVPRKRIYRGHVITIDDSPDSTFEFHEIKGVGHFITVKSPHEVISWQVDGKPGMYNIDPYYRYPIQKV